jgi:antitoxin (DNA-binding transcriptional repressor) of toxin-antitoxin stability system
MKKQSVNIAKFKARMGKYLAGVKSGNEVILMDRQTAVARVIPYTAGDVVPPEVKDPIIPFRSAMKKKLRPAAEKVKIDSLFFLLQERGSR